MTSGGEQTPGLERVHLILYVGDPARSRAFYAQLLGKEPRLDVPGMTEFELPGGAILGLMPEAGIRRLLGDALPPAPPDPPPARAELYLLVADPAAAHARALALGARELAPPAPRDWGHVVGYALDLDGYVVAFAREAGLD